MNPATHCVAMTTCGNREAAEMLAGNIIRARLAACIQIFPITSFFEWKGEVQHEDEVLMLLKTRTAIYGALEKFISEHHEYEVPEIIQLPVNAGLGAYLGWIDEVTAEAESGA
jgi:periplasmic divalent cation tolerance protein